VKKGVTRSTHYQAAAGCQKGIKRESECGEAFEKECRLKKDPFLLPKVQDQETSFPHQNRESKKKLIDRGGMGSRSPRSI